jgi:hypothetical protein
MVMNVGAFVSPLVSVALANLIGIRPALFVGAAFWLAGGLLFLFRPPQPVTPTVVPGPAN